MLLSFKVHELYVPKLSQINMDDLHPYDSPWKREETGL